MQHRNPRTYTIANIQEWQTGLNNIPNSIESCHKEIAATESRINELEKTLAILLSHDINPVVHNIDGLEARINVLILPAQISQLNQQIEVNGQELAKLYPQLQAARNVLAPIDEQIAKLTAAIAMQEANDAITQKEQALRDQAALISQLENEDSVLDRRLSDMHETLRSKNARLDSLRTEQNFDAVLNHGYSSHTSLHHDNHHDHHHHGHHLSDALHSINDFQRAKTISQLQSEIASLQIDHDRLEREHSNIESRLSSAKSYSRQLEGEINSLKQTVRMNDLALINFQYPARVYDTRNLLAQTQARRQEPARIEAQLALTVGTQERTKHRLLDERRSQQSLLTRSEPLSKPYANTNDLGDLRSELQLQREKLSRFNQQKMALTTDIQQAKADLHRQQASLGDMQNQLSRLQNNQFLQTLQNNPGALLQTLHQALLANLTAYDHSHPAEQNVAVRACLYTMPNAANNILVPTETVTPDTTRQKYYQLCGLIHAASRRPQQAPDFIQLMNATLGEDTLDALETLQAYHQLNSPELSHDEVHQQDQLNYQAAYARFNALLAHLPHDASRELRDFHHKGQHLLNTIEARKASHARRQDAAFDTKYHTTLLKTAANVLEAPGEANRQLLNSLATHNLHGRPSPGQKVMGAVLMFLGAAAAISSLCIGVFSMGLLTPLALSGMIAGGVLLIAGAALILHGRRKGLDQALVQYDQAAHSVHLAGSMFKKQADHSAYQVPPSAPPMNLALKVF